MPLKRKQTNKQKEDTLKNYKRVSRLSGLLGWWGVSDLVLSLKFIERERDWGKKSGSFHSSLYKINLESPHRPNHEHLSRNTATANKPRRNTLKKTPSALHTAEIAWYVSDLSLNHAWVCFDSVDKDLYWCRQKSGPDVNKRCERKSELFYTLGLLY